jgi:hypothetical protein
LSVTGLTSNLTIFCVKNSAHTRRSEEGRQVGRGPVLRLALEDLGRDRPIWDRRGVDGWVSLEVSR